MLMQAGKEEEGRKELNALASSETHRRRSPSARSPISISSSAIATPPRSAYSNLVSSGRFVYESLFYLGAIAESRESWDDAVQIYSRVTGGDFAMAAQTRAARIKAQRQGLDAGLKHLEEFAATRPQYRIDAITARATLLANNGDVDGALALLDSALEGISGFGRAALRPRVPARRRRQGERRDRRAAQARGRSSRRSGRDQCARLHAGRSHAPASRRPEADRAGARADAGQRRGARQHGLGAASRRSQRGCADVSASTPSAASTIRKSTCISAKCCSRWIARTTRAMCWSKASERYPDNARAASSACRSSN